MKMLIMRVFPGVALTFASAFLRVRLLSRKLFPTLLRPANTTMGRPSRMKSRDDTADLIMRTKKAGKRVIAVGTTSVRTLEAAAAAPNLITGKSGSTDIFIKPGYEFKIVDAMVTNFHLPKSTLIMLVAAFAGREFVLDAYRRAVKERYRFFSFGDAMFIERKKIAEGVSPS